MAADADVWAADVKQGAAAAEASRESYLCQACGGMVARARQQTHEDYWCPALHL